MFRRVMVANRGEVAVRVLRTLRRMKIESVLVVTEPDQDLSYLKMADRVVRIGGARNYLSADAIIQAALDEHCSALHPGWGFLSENPTFARRCESARITFIGPSAACMRSMADKAVARETMTRLGLPPIPGSNGVLRDLDAARSEAERIGYPVLLKAVAGGGGRGMRRVYRSSELAAAFGEATGEAATAFGCPDLYMERLIEGGRHIEIQVLGDGQECVVLGARECSVQRRHQKLLEETPPPGIDQRTLETTFARVKRAVAALGYRGAGTVEMLQDHNGELWFMEMNTRLQVEHTVTEEVTGIDLVEWQLRIAANQGLDHFPVVEPKGWAIECRINAEQAELNFQPTPGLIECFDMPVGAGIRVDTHLAQGDRISPHYDSMIAKLIVHGEDRDKAIEKMLTALSNLQIKGVPSTVDIHRRILTHPQFRSGQYDTTFLESAMDQMLGVEAQK